VGKRSQQAELERNNQFLSERVEELSRLLAAARDRDNDLDLYNNLNRHVIDRELLGHSRPPSIIPEGDDSHDAALLLNLKQGHDLSGARASPAGPHRRLGEQFFRPERVNALWDEFFKNYNFFLPILDPEKDSPDSVYDKSDILFWSVLIVAARHFPEDPTQLHRMLPGYHDLIKDTICRPPNNHHVVKALCLLCTWPPPVSSTTADMTFAWSGIMMKFALQLGLHRPSHPMDFSRTRVQLREEDISDRLQTWIICNIVAQNISTGYGQPPDTVYDSTLNSSLQSRETTGNFAALYARLEIEKLADKITRNVYSQAEKSFTNFAESYSVKAEIMSQEFQRLESSIDMTIRKQLAVTLFVRKMTNKLLKALNHLYAAAANLHLKLFVFFDEPSSQSYRLNLNELYDATRAFLGSAFEPSIDLRFAPNYILQMMLAAAVALLKLLNSFFATYVVREAGQELFWDTIAAIRQMSVKTNDLAQRLAEVFAQMWQADAERMAERDTFGDTKPKIGEIDASLTLKRRYRMSMSHVFDSIWRWKDELQGKVRAEKLEAAVKDPTSPQATTHRGSFSNGRRSSTFMDDSTLPGMTSFGGFGGMPLSGSENLAYADSYQFFDSVGWYLDDLFGNANINYSA
jgi:transcription factor-like protein